MPAKEELIRKYPSNISATYFKYGIIFDWDEEYYDIVWDHNITGVVILELFKHGIIINGIDVMIKQELLFDDGRENFIYEGSSWNRLTIGTNDNIPNEIKAIDATIIYSSMMYLEKFNDNVSATTRDFYFKISF